MGWGAAVLAELVPWQMWAGKTPYCPAAQTDTESLEMLGDGPGFCCSLKWLRQDDGLWEELQ